MPPKKKKEEYDWFDDAGQGFENVGSGDLGLPFLGLIQKMSDEADETTGKYIEGAKPGMIFDTVSREILGGSGEPVEVIPCVYKKMYVEWRPREGGGGLVAMHEDSSILKETTRDDKGQDVLEDGNLIVTTAYFFGLYKQDDDWHRCVISMTSTQLKKARRWLSMMTSIKLDGKNGKFTPPMFSHTYLLSSIPEENTKGSWWGWKIEKGELLSDPPLIGMVKENHQALSGGFSQNLLSEGNGDNSPF